jgi:CheY-like chemotaxis protein
MSAHNARVTPELQDTAGLEKLRILLAEDEAIGARFAIAAAQRLGHEVVRVETGSSALDLLKRERFDVALLDLGLPELDGLDVARRIRHHERDRGGCPLVIVALTAGQLDERTREEAGIDAVLEKPVQVKLLGETLASCHARSQALRAVSLAPEVDLAALFERASQDEDLVREVLHDFLSTCDDMLGEVVMGVDSRDFSTAAIKAHRLRGALLALGANRAAEAAGEVELVAATTAAAGEAWDTHIEAVAKALHVFRERLAAARTEMHRFVGE